MNKYKLFQTFVFKNMTRGLMGNWTFDIQDDFTTPDGTERAVYQTDDLENVHKDFAMKCKFYCSISTKRS